jgi:hypothetical protein
MTPKHRPPTLWARVALSALLALCAWQHSQAATTYYLNPATGSDLAAGGISTPWQTLAKVKTSAGPGDTVNIRGGTYTPAQYQGSVGIPQWNENQSHGAPGQLLTIQAFPGETVIFEGGTVQQYWMNILGNTTKTDRYLIIQNLTFRNFAGAVITVEKANYVTVQNCQFLSSTGGGSPLVTFDASHVIFQNNLINISGSHGLYISEGSTFNVYSGNTFLDVGAINFGSGSGTAFGIHLWGHYSTTLPVDQNLIIRKNVVANALTCGFTFAGNTYQNIYIYHNTFYQDSSNQVTYGILNTHNAGTYIHDIILNNIGDGYATPGVVFSDPGQAYTALTLDYNLWRNPSGAPLYAWNGSTYTTLSAFQSATGYDLHSLNVNPLFTNPSTKDFTLQSSSLAIDAGRFLTTTVGTGTSSTLVTVADAGFFHDGYGMVSGDTIRVGSQTVTITAVNYAANTLTVTPAISWSSGQGVSLPYSGSAPDLGAFEVVTSSTATQLAFTAQPQSTTPGATLTPVVVEVRTAANIVDTTSTAAVTLALSGGPGFFPGTAALQTQTFVVSKAGRYVRLITLADANGSNSASAAEITVLNAGTPIAQSGMSVVSISSQESSACCGGPHLATHALDGNPATHWFTQYTGGKLGPPYTLILDLGASYAVSGWTYLPHQVDDPDGYVTQYTLWVSTDGTTWGTAMTDAGLTGTLTRNAVGGVATFPGLAFATPAPDYRLTASAPGLTPAISTPFTISGRQLSAPTNVRVISR